MADALPLAEPIHAIPGRTRLRIEERSGDGAFFASIATGLSAIRGVSHVDVRPLTGSIVIHHAAPLARIGVAAEEARLFVIADALVTARLTASPSPSIRELSWRWGWACSQSGNSRKAAFCRRP